MSESIHIDGSGEVPPHLMEWVVARFDDEPLLSEAEVAPYPNPELSGVDPLGRPPVAQGLS